MLKWKKCPRCQRLLEIFRQLLGFDLISSEWASGLMPVSISLVTITCLFIAALAAWYNYTYNEAGILRSVGEKIKKAFGSKQD